MQIRIIEITEEDYDGEKNKLISYFSIDEKTKLNEFIKTLYEIKKIQEIDMESIGLELNTKDIADNFGEWYNIDSITLNIPDVKGEKTVLPYIAVYVKSLY